MPWHIHKTHYRTSWVTVLNFLTLKLLVSMETVLELFASQADVDSSGTVRRPIWWCQS